jgi:hypothetical protein
MERSPHNWGGRFFILADIATTMATAAYQACPSIFLTAI